jgi:hypothetical protein
MTCYGSHIERKAGQNDLLSEFDRVLAKELGEEVQLLLHHMSYLLDTMLYN